MYWYMSLSNIFLFGSLSIAIEIIAMYECDGFLLVSQEDNHIFIDLSNDNQTYKTDILMELKKIVQNNK